jgi:glycosyltransferase involved in cell wall biosynthesis
VTKLVETLADDDAWAVTVLTVDASNYGTLDTSHNPAPGHARVVRTFCPDPARSAKRQAPAIAAAAGPAQTKPAQPGLVTRGVKCLRRGAGMAWTWVDEHVLIPDQFVAWTPFALRAARAIHAERRVDVVFATGEPYSAFRIGAKIAAACGVPYVLDMRDPWTLQPYRVESRPAWRQQTESRMEYELLAGSAACVFANRALGAYASTYPELASRLHYIPNGYDPADLAGLEPRPFDRFTIVHSGTFLPGYRTIDTVVAALQRLVPAAADLPPLRLELVGKTGPERVVIDHAGLGNLAASVGYVPHRESLRYVLGADLLLLVGGPRLWEETGKVYEYLAAGKPILALVEPGGSAAQLLARVPHATVLGRDDVAGTATAVLGALARGRVTTREPAPEWLAEYERPALSRRLAALLATVCESSSVPVPHKGVS